MMASILESRAASILPPGAPARTLESEARKLKTYFFRTIWTVSLFLSLSLSLCLSLASLSLSLALYLSLHPLVSHAPTPSSQ